MRDWWREPVDYEGYVQYFADRGLLGIGKTVVGGVIGCITVLALAWLLPSASASPTSVVMWVLFAAGAAFWSAMWWFRPWPTHWQSRAFIISVDLGIAAIALVSSNWLVAIFAYHCFALASVYLVFLDGPKVLAAHNAVVLSTVIGFVGLNVGENGIVDAASARISLAAAIPVAAATGILLVGIQILRNDANKSTADSLTGLLNRRGLYLHLRKLVDRPHSPEHRVTVIVADLDQFKSINDTFGHTVGDNVLIQTAHRISSAVGSNAVVARSGGEEFVIIDTTAPDETAYLADTIRSALNSADDNPTVTASLGVYTCQWPQSTQSDADLARFFDEAIARADEAMFRAKRSGGNMVSRYAPEQPKTPKTPQTKR